MDRLGNLSGKHNFLTFPPNCLEFKALCQAYYEDLRLPKSHEAYREIKNFSDSNCHPWSHPVTEFIANRLPNDFYRIEDEHKASALFNQLYEEVTDLIKQGHDLPEFKTQINRQPARSPEVARSYLQQLKQHLGA